MELEALARSAVAEAVAAADAVGGDAAATASAFNQLAAAYGAAVRATATAPSARWGLPAPEVQKPTNCSRPVH